MLGFALAAIFLGGNLVQLILMMRMPQRYTAEEIREAYFEGFEDAKDVVTVDLNPHEHWSQSFWYDQLNP